MSQCSWQARFVLPRKRFRKLAQAGVGDRRIVPLRCLPWTSCQEWLRSSGFDRSTSSQASVVYLAGVEPLEGVVLEAGGCTGCATGQGPIRLGVEAELESREREIAVS